MSQHSQARARMTAWFVTGTDTGVGKTLVATALMHHLRERFGRVAGMKPVAAGAQRTPDGSWSNEDVLALREAGRLFERDSRWKSGFDIGETEVPQGIRLILERRLESVSGEKLAATLARVERLLVMAGDDNGLGGPQAEAIDLLRALRDDLGAPVAAPVQR